MNGRWMPLCDWGGCARYWVRTEGRDERDVLEDVIAHTYDLATPRDAVGVFWHVDSWMYACDVHLSNATSAVHKLNDLPSDAPSGSETQWNAVLLSAWGVKIPA